MPLKISKLRELNWQKLLIPEFPISALSFEDRIVRVFGFNKKITRLGKIGRYILPAGVIEEGIIKKPDILKSFLHSLKNNLWRKEKKVWVILSLPSNNFFTNIFSLPELPSSQLRDAIIFNTQMSAPIPLEESYFDWEDWGSSLKEGEREIFIAIGIKKQIQPYLEALESNNFQVVAVEPTAVSLARFVGHFIEAKEPVLTINLRNDGIEFLVSEGTKVIYFDYDSWSEIFAGKVPKVITLQHLEDHLSRELPLILNFYILKRNKDIKKFLCLGENEPLVKAIISWIQAHYQLVSLPFKLPRHLQGAKRDWATVIGAALRGLIPRSKDTIVSLAPIGTEESYTQNHFLSVLSLWLKVISVVSLSIAAFFFSVFRIYFLPIANSYQKSLSKPINTQLVSKYNQLKSEVKEFNDLVETASSVKQKTKRWHSVISFIFTAAKKQSINVQRLFIAKDISIQGIARNKEAAIRYQKELENSHLFKKVSLPLESLVDTPQGTNFALSLTL